MLALLRRVFRGKIQNFKPRSCHQVRVEEGGGLGWPTGWHGLLLQPRGFVASRWQAGEALVRCAPSS